MPPTPTLLPMPAPRARSSSVFVPGSVEPPPTVQVATVPPPPAVPLPPYCQSVAVTPPPVGELSRSCFANRPGSEAPATMPQPGESFHGFRLVEELGRGTFARVFLAKQEALAGRDVALKVTLRPTREADRLARLQHTNIVPVYSVHNANPVQLICMPFVGRRTLADLLTGYRQSHVSAGHSTRKALLTRRGSSAVHKSHAKSWHRDQNSGSHPKPAEPTAAPAEADPLVGNVRRVLQLLSQLADGLAHAHARGILHLDLKPANVLFADDGEPMLLDFNLSFDAAESDRELVGGTIPYMAPEQLLDLRTRGKGKVDVRTDLYALGVIAFELLTGTHPFAFSAKTLAEFEGMMAARKKGPPPIRDLNPAVTPAIEAIVRKLLAPEPADRYQSAADLKDDLDRQLADRPLKFAADRSFAERVGKWRRRNPRAVVVMGLAVAVALACGTGAVAYTESQKVAAGEAKDRIATTRDALDTIRLDLVLPGDPKARARGTARALELLREYGLPEDPNWRDGKAFNQIPSVDRAAATGDLGELLLLLAHARWEDGKRTDKAGAANDALILNRQAESCFGESVPPYLFRQRGELEAAAGLLPVPGGSGTAQTARDHFLDAVGLMAESKPSSAIAALERVVAGQPDHAAAHFFVGWCRYENRQYPEAIERLRVARGRMPTEPRIPLWVGMTYTQQSKYAEAEGEFTRSIRLDPASGEVYRKRGFVRHEQGKYHEAEADFTEALARSGSPARVYPLRAAVRADLGDEAGAKADRLAAGESRPDDEEDFIIRGLVYLPEQPDRALADFRAAAELNPKSLRALQNQAHILGDYLGDNEGALGLLTRLVELYPDNPPARAERAYVLARLGRGEEARQEAGRISRQSVDSKVAYKLGCAFALLSRTQPEEQSVALDYLRQAFRNGYRNLRMFETDADLNPLRDTQGFAELARAVDEVYRNNTAPGEIPGAEDKSNPEPDEP